MIRCENMPRPLQSNSYNLSEVTKKLNEILKKTKTNALIKDDFKNIKELKEEDE